MRTFIAIELPSSTRDELKKIQEKFKANPGVSANFVNPENLHLTLKFLGEIPEEKVEQIKKLKIDFKKFKVNLGKVGVFPSLNYIRILWVSLEPGFLIKDLHDKIEEILQAKKDVKFESHITLARIKNLKSTKDFLKEMKNTKVNNKEFEVGSIVLKKSTLEPGKLPVYENLFVFEGN
ncbi:MAG: RNA 2',3'-cyclic phosphodiesterase [archaeon]